MSTRPSGGERTAMLIAFVALAAGVGLAALLVLVGTLIGGRTRQVVRSGAPGRVRVDVVAAPSTPGK